MLTFVGLGLGPKGVSLEGLEAIRSSDAAYLEYYTTPHEPTLLPVLEREAGKSITVVDRQFVEDGRRILEEAASRRVVLAVPGDPMIATTHSELRARAAKQGIETKVVHATTIAAAAASASGLHYYKFSRTVTITRESLKRLSQQYRVLQENLLQGAHTLLLLEQDTESGEGVSPSDAIAGLGQAEENYKRGVVGEHTYCLVLSRLGGQDGAVMAGEFGSFRGKDFGAPPHCIVIPGSLHFTESEAIASMFPTGTVPVHGNSESVKRTAQVLVPKYVAKTRKALASARDQLGPSYESVLENAELYAKDAENFLAEGEDEMAMLSIGYAEGLLDSLNFAGVVKIDW